MPIPLRQNLRVASYLHAAEARRPRQVPSDRRDRAALRVQPRLPGLRQDPAPRPRSCASASRVDDVLDAMEECGAPMCSIAGGEPLLHPDIEEMVAELDRAQGLRLPVHERGAAAPPDRSVQAVAVLLVGHPPRRPARAPRRTPSTARACSTRPSTAIREAQEPRVPGHHQLDVLQHRLAQDRARRPRLPQRRPRGSTR